MAEHPTIFVSAVSSELGTFRQAVRDTLLSKGVFPYVQEGFPTDYRELREMLTKRIAKSDAVICLVGFAYGVEPKSRPDGEPRRSYTQLEYHLARKLGKPVYIFLTDDDARPCDAVPNEGDEFRLLQIAHRTDIRDRDELWHEYATLQELKTKVAKIPIVERTGSRFSTSRLHHGADHLVGREGVLADLDQAWDDSATHVVTIVAWGGVGKTSLVIEWMARRAAGGWAGFERVFDWSFYSQGTREQGAASADAFVAAALTFFGDKAMAQSAVSAWDKGARLAELVAQRRSLLVLDGLEPLQYPPGPLTGRLKDPAIEALLRGLARQNPGLCLVTTREQVADLAPYRDTTAPEWELEHLSEEAGAALLHQSGATRAGAVEIEPDDPELRGASQEVEGHALTLRLLGRYLAKAHRGDIRRRDRVRFEKADAKVQGGHAFKTMAAYEKWLLAKQSVLQRLFTVFSAKRRADRREGRRQLAVLRLLGLFDRPADGGCLAALRREPAIRRLTEPLVGLGEEDWNLTLSSLADSDLISVRSEESAIPNPQSAIDAHPLLREYFAKQLREKCPEAWRAAHRRLYEHLTDSTEHQPDTLEGLEPLYQAVAHGCQAGMQQEACDEVYYARIQRGQEFYSTRKLGAFGADIGAVACFFEQSWGRISPALAEADQAWLLAQAAFRLRALGRLTEALEPMRVSLEMEVDRETWTRAAGIAGNLSELSLTLGIVPDAVGDAERSVDFADRSGNASERVINRATLADILHQAGSRADALARFREAEGMQTKGNPKYPLLYSARGFQYCDLLLAEAARAAWQHSPGPRPMPNQGQDARSTLIARCCEVGQRAAKTLRWSEDSGLSLLTMALDHLTLGRVALYREILDESTIRNTLSTFDQTQEQLTDAVDRLRRAGEQRFVPAGLLSRAWLRFLEGDADGARVDLDDAWQIAERGPMRLHMADIHLYRARLFHAVRPYPWKSPWDDLAAARKLIKDCGYHRRDEELADAEEAAKGWGR